MKQTAYINVYLVLLKEDEILLSLRQNTGYEDGKWSLVSGHGETNESALTSLIREAKEEADINLKPFDLTVSHIMHRKTTRNNIDIFVKCLAWHGKIINKEPEKCGDLKFFNLNALPSNTISYILDAVTCIQNNIFYSEQGWDVC